MVIVGTKQNMILSAGGWVNGLILLFCSSSIYRAIQHHPSSDDCYYDDYDDGVSSSLPPTHTKYVYCQTTADTLYHYNDCLANILQFIQITLLWRYMDVVGTRPHHNHHWWSSALAPPPATSHRNWNYLHYNHDKWHSQNNSIHGKYWKIF